MPVGIYASLFIPGPMPGMNEILAARGQVGGFIEGTTKRANQYGALKKHWAGVVQTYALQERLKPRCIPAAHFTFLHWERDQLRDPDNFCGGAQKLGLDALKLAGLIDNDGWRHVLGIRHHWLCRPAVDGWQGVGVQLYASASDTLTMSEAVALSKPVIRRVELIPRASEARLQRARRSKRAASLARA